VARQSEQELATEGAIMVWHPGQAYGQDLRDRILNAKGSIREVALRFGVSESYVARARSRRRRLGQDTPGVQCNHVPAKLSGLEQALAARVAAVNDQTLQQLGQWLQAEHGIQVGVTTLWRTLARLGLSLKKRHSMPQSRRAQTS
jgi:transposase